MDLNPLLVWFLQNMRVLPWREYRTPYRVFVSEIMLQQTQVDRVTGFFQRWMERFPDVQSIARAELDEIYTYWEGLGYYSRARQLHKAAKALQNLPFFPDTQEALLDLPGVGPYTVNALLAFAFNKKAMPLDANVKRVLSRLFCTEEGLQEKGNSILPNLNPGQAAEAVMELGATICTPRPNCSQCPLQSQCQAFALKRTGDFPSPKKKKEAVLLTRIVAVLLCENAILIRKIDKKGLMQGLCEFPFIEKSPETDPSEIFSSLFKLPLKMEKSLGRFSQSFTHYRVTLLPFLFSCSEKKPIQNYFWLEFPDTSRYAFSSGHKRILNHVASFTQ